MRKGFRKISFTFMNLRWRNILENSLVRICEAEEEPDTRF